MKLRFGLYILIIYKLLFSQVFADILFSEIFPNTDDDVNMEYIELINSGDSDINLNGFVLKDKSEKEFVFPETEKLTSGERKKYYRTQTKILLNNSDEELFLHDNNSNLIDSFIYSETVKGEVISINFSEIGINIPEKDNSDLDSGADNSGVNDVEENSIEDNNIEDNNIEDNNIETEIIYQVPNVIYSFQSPTYLIEPENTTSIYNCDRSKETCKINLDFRNSFVGNFSESDFICETNFGFNTDQQNKCNPSTIVVPEGNYEFKIKIIHKNSDITFSEKILTIVNDGYVKLVTKKSGGSSKKKNTGVPKLIIKKPEIIVQSGLNENNECSNLKNCNINFKYPYASKFEKCEWDFGGGIFDSGVNTKCDPYGVKYGTGEFEVSLRVYERGDYNNFKTTEFHFSNGFQNSEKEIGSKEIVIYELSPNPKGSDEFEYIELKNNSSNNFNLGGCYLDDILEGGSKKYNFEKYEILNAFEIKKYPKTTTKINLNNSGDEVNLFCNETLIDNLSWDFIVEDGYLLNHSNLDLFSGKAKVLEVIDGDTIKIQFLDSEIVENLRLVGIDTPETKHPDKEIEKLGIEATDFVYDMLDSQEVIIELNSNNLRDIYSRLLGFVYIDGENFNKKVIEKGYSKAYTKYDFKYKDDFIKAEKIAKKDGLGIWGTSNIYIDENTENNFENNSLESKIIIQGKVGSNKVLDGNTITCFDTCSINFDGSESIGDIKTYSWDFGNGDEYIGKNPGYIKYETYGNYTANLLVVSDSGELDTSKFYVNFYKKQKASKKNILPKANADNYDEKKKAETISDSENEIILQQTNIEDKYSSLLYVLIGLFAGTLIMLILLREKLF